MDFPTLICILQLNGGFLYSDQQLTILIAKSVLFVTWMIQTLIGVVNYIYKQLKNIDPIFIVIIFVNLNSFFFFYEHRVDLNF